MDSIFSTEFWSRNSSVATSATIFQIILYFLFQPTGVFHLLVPTSRTSSRIPSEELTFIIFLAFLLTLFCTCNVLQAVFLSGFLNSSTFVMGILFKTVCRYKYIELINYQKKTIVGIFKPEAHLYMKKKQ